MNKRKSFTLLETIVTIVIYAIMLLMITNVVMINARLSQQLKLRSRIRSEMAQITSLIRRDIRNATTIKQSDCTGTICSMDIIGNNVVWTYNASDHTLTKRIGASQDYYVSSNLLYIEEVTFTLIPDQDLQSKRATIIVTIKAKGSKEEWKITNQIIQEVISTRNYALTL